MHAVTYMTLWRTSRWHWTLVLVDGQAFRAVCGCHVGNRCWQLLVSSLAHLLDVVTCPLITTCKFYPVQNCYPMLFPCSRVVILGPLKMLAKMWPKYSFVLDSNPSWSNDFITSNACIIFPFPYFPMTRTVLVPHFPFRHFQLALSHPWMKANSLLTWC